MSTTYKIEHNGRTFYTTDAEKANELSKQGADVTACTTEEPEGHGIPIQMLSDDELQELERIADANDWGRVRHMIRNRRQTRIE